MSDRNETLAQVINAAVEGGLLGVYTCIPARVVKWDASKCRADCQILVKRVDRDEEGKRVVESWPVVPGVLVQFMGANGARLTLPIQAGQNGTIGTLFFSHSSLDKWATGSGGEVDPEDDSSHGLADAVFMPGLRTFGSTWQSVPDEMSIGDDADGNGRIHFPSGQVELGDGASKGVARKDDPAGGGSLAFTFGAGTGGASLSITYTPGDGSTPQSLPAGSGTLSIKEKITSASQHIKAVD